ncbi:MAG TPA: PBP1A family penicillin-binding protein [Vicinamibacterales bacterium]|nr:PBP1A family penicillin-binding protein [Vicinamibacterales bacterium]
MATFHVVVFTHAVASELERADALAELTPKPQATTVFDRTGKPAFTFFLEQRVDVTLDRVAPAMLDAIVAVEDQRFYKHRGLDPVRIAASAWNNVRANKIVQGGSTITQQLARAAQQLSPKRTYERKIREAMIASRLEQRYSKSEILEAYLNAVYFGEGYYGVEAASQGYFGKPASRLEAHEAALLAAIVRAPSHDAPRVSPVRAKARRDLVLRLMRDQGRLAESQYITAVAAPIPAASHRAEGNLVARGGSGVGLYFEEELRRQLVAQFGNERVLRGGLRVYSTYDPRLQQSAEKAINTRIAQIAASRPKARDLQGSLVAMDPKTGDVLALVGGRDFRASKYNRATQARRQAGSAFKPMLYAAALERGFAPGTMLKDLDSPILTAGESWLPSGDHEQTEYTLRRALKVSSNRAAAQLMQQVGTSTTAYYAQRLGIESPMPMVPSLALGTGEVTLLELTSAYTAFANRGITSMPRLYTRVDDAQGTALYFHEERHVQAISASTAYMMSSMLSDVISSGTGTGVRAAGFKLPAAGKTGTTDDYADAWFVGYTPHIVTGVWFGLDRPAPIMARGFGGTVAVPAWATFMKDATAGAKPDWYEMPGDLEKVAICPLSGSRATDACRYHAMPAAVPVATVATDLVDADGVSIASALPVATPRAAVAPRAKVYEDVFPIGAVPSEPCPLHSPAGQPGDLLGTTGEGALATPIVDASLQLATADVAAPPAATVRSANPRIFVDRVVGSDGVVRTVMRQR